MEEKRRITIIGTGCMGTSLGLALRQSRDADHLEIVGHDRELGHAREALRLGGLDRVEFNLDLALNKARLIIVAVPLASLRETLEDVARLLEPELGTVITSIAPLMGPVLDWARELLPTGNPFVAGNLAPAPETSGWEPLTGAAAARADLFEKAIYAIATQSTSHPSAIRTVTNLAGVLGAEPLLVDPGEHDAVSTLASMLPDITATALFQAVGEDPGWPETRKIAGRPLGTATAATSGDAESRRMAALLGRTALLRGLDRLRDRLDILTKAIENGEAEVLDAAFAQTAQARAQWIKESLARTWQVDQSALPEKDSLFNRTVQAFLGEGIARYQRRQP